MAAAGDRVRRGSGLTCSALAKLGLLRAADDGVGGCHVIADAGWRGRNMSLMLLRGGMVHRAEWVQDGMVHRSVHSRVEWCTGRNSAQSGWNGAQRSM